MFRLLKVEICFNSDLYKDQTKLIIDELLIQNQEFAQSFYKNLQCIPK